MKYPQILETLTTTPLLITPGYADALHKMFADHATMTADEFRSQRTGADICGESVELEQMTVENGLASIPVNGPLGIRLGSFEKGAGAVDYLDIMDDINSACADPAVQNILLYFDSPGGMNGGLPETGKLIEECEKPVYAFIPAGGYCCSAAYWLASCCDGIFACPSAQIGSIGVYCAYMDLSKMAEERGIKVKVFSSGAYKGMGIAGTSLTDEQEKYLQDMVMELAEAFYDQVTTARNGNVPDEAMQGQSFTADKAMENGLIDEVVKDEQSVRSFLTA